MEETINKIICMEGFPMVGCQYVLTSNMSTLRETETRKSELACSRSHMAVRSKVGTGSLMTFRQGWGASSRHPWALRGLVPVLGSRGPSVPRTRTCTPSSSDH